MDQPPPAGRSPHGDLRGPCVEGVVQQFAHHRGRALDHLAGRDLADEFLGQVADGAGGGRGGRGAVLHVGGGGGGGGFWGGGAGGPWGMWLGWPILGPGLRWRRSGGWRDDGGRRG